MEQLVRRAAIVTTAGIVASVPLIASLGHIQGIVILGAVLGALDGGTSCPLRTLGVLT